jgi:hypothetical protein
MADHPYASLFVVALVVRLGSAIAVYVLFGGSLLLDDATYSEMAAQAAVGDDASWDPYVEWLYRRTAALLWPLTLLYRITGPHILVGQMFVAVFGALTAVVTFRLASEALDRRGAIIAGTVVALLPSQIIFSSLVMKDAQAWVLLASVAVLVAYAGRVHGWTMFSAVLAVGGLLFLLGFVRLHTAAVASIALLLTCWTGQRRERLLRAGALALVAVLVPIFLGIGPLGLNFATVYGAQLESIRAAQATGGSAIAAARAPTRRPETSDQGSPQASGDAARYGDEGFSLQNNVRYLPVGIFVMLVEPTPWRSGGSTALRLAQLESLVWYPLLALAFVGLSQLWRYRRSLMFPCVVGGGTLLMWALVEGNAGTAYRHRGEFVWAVCVLAVVGLSRMSRSWTPRLRPAPTAEEHPTA